MLKNGYEIEDALNEILAIRPFVRPNLVMAGYMENLLEKPGIVTHLKSNLDYNTLN